LINVLGYNDGEKFKKEFEAAKIANKMDFMIPLIVWKSKQISLTLVYMSEYFPFSAETSKESDADKSPESSKSKKKK